jgi:hypothetical protein
MTELGGKTYDVLNKKQNLETDRTIKAIFVKIKKLEAQLHKLEAVKKTFHSFLLVIFNNASSI